MPMTVTHKFVSAKSDSPDSTLINPSNWNDTHTISNFPFVFNTDYIYTPQTPGTNLVIGSNTITLNPMPVGLNTGGSAYISGGIGTAEGVPITGISGNQIIVTCANTHSGAWTIQSASAGIAEALRYLWLNFGYGKVWIPGGDYNIYAGINVPMSFAYIEGFGESVSNLHVAANANNSTLGFLIFNTYAYNVGGVKSLSIRFIEPDSTDVTTYTHWAPAIYYGNGGGLKIQDVLIQAAWIGVYGTSCNGMDISNLRISSFSRSVWIDYSADSVKIRGLHVYSAYGLTNNQSQVMYNNNYGLSIGQVDDLQVSEYTAGTYLALFSYTGSQTGGSSFGNLTNCNFDTFGGIVMGDGILQITNSQFSPSGTSQAVYIQGGVLKLSAVRIFNMATQPALQTAFGKRLIRGTISADAILSIENSWIYNQSDEYFIVSSTATGYIGNAETIVVNNQFVRPTNVAYTHAGIYITEAASTSNRAIVIGNNMTDAGSGSGVWFFATLDEFHVVSRNTAPGLTYTLPATLQKMLVDFPATTTSVTSASTITPTGPLFHITGTVAINSITTPTGFPYTTFSIIPDGAFTLVASATIGKSSTAVVGQIMTMTLDQSTSKWFPSY